MKPGTIRLARWVGWTLPALVAAVLCGCGDTSSTTQPAAGGSSATQPLSAKQVLAKTAALYRQATSYADAGELRFSAVAKDGQRTTDDPRPLSTALERPNKLRMQMFGANVMCDGQQMIAWVEHIPGQVLRLPAPKHIELKTLIGDDHLGFAMTGGLEGIVCPQLELLTGPPPWEEEGVEPVLLEEGRAGDRLCYRVGVPLAGGQRIYWIDKESLVVHRVDLPTDPLKPQLDPEGRLASLEAWVAMPGVRLDGPIDGKAFQYELPSDVRLVSRFVPPLSDPPKRVGETVGDFTFVDLEDNEVARDTLSEKVLVLAFWDSRRPESRQCLAALQQLSERLKDNARVEVLAVAIDGEETPSAAIAEKVAAWDIGVRVLRDRAGQFEKVFAGQQVPAVFLMAPDDKNRHYEIHDYRAAWPVDEAALAASLAENVERLLDGKDVAQQALDFYAAEQHAYETELASAAIEATQPLVEILRTEVAPASKPKTFQLVKLWQCDEVKQPGNVYLVDGAGQPPRIFVHDGWRAVVEVGLDGNVVARHELKIPERAAVSFLRIAADADGKLLFAASAARGQQLFVFDEAFQLLLSFPEGKHDGIGDVQWCDLDGSGRQRLLVGYWGVVGLQLVSLEGQRLWSSRKLENVLHVAVAPLPDSHQSEALCVTTRGTLLPVDAKGTCGDDIRVGDRAITNLVVADVNGDGQMERCALAAVPATPGAVTALGVDAEGKELWSYELPSGYHEVPIERIVPAHLAADDGGWLLPAADGSIHLLTAAGELVDRFHYGARLAGLALTQHEFPLLLVSSSEGFAAWKIQSE